MPMEFDFEAVVYGHEWTQKGESVWVKVERILGVLNKCEHLF